MADFPENIQSATPARYLFKLVSGLQEVICNPEPLEWASGTLEINRDIEVAGVFSSFQVDSLTFVGTGAKLLKQLFNAEELNAECTLIVYWWQGSTRTYIEFPTRFDINFNFYETVKVGKFSIGVRIKAINNSVQTKLDNRKDIDVDLTKLTSIGGFPIADYHLLKKGLHFDATNVFIYGSMDSFYAPGWDLPRVSGSNCYASVPFQRIIASEYPEFSLVDFYNRSLQLSYIQKFFKSSLFLYTDIDFHYQITVNVVDEHGGTPPWNLQLIETSQSGNIIQTITLESFGNSSGVIYMQDTIQVTIQKDSDLRLVIQTLDISGIKALLTAARIELKQTISETQAKQTEGFPIYEALERNCQHILDAQYPFYSEFFGRTDTPYNYNGNTYPTENQLRFAHIQTGLNQRGATLTDINYTIPTSFLNLFKTVKSIWNVGYTIDSLNRIRIEQYAYFFQNVQILDISDRINKYDIVSMVMPELVPIDIQSGFSKYEYLQVNGRGEPNTTNKRTSPMNTMAKFENISRYRGDSKGIFDNLNNPIDANGTTDTKGDEDIFIVKTQRDIDYNWKPEKDTNIEIEDNTSLFGEDLLNRYFTPSRMLKRHGNVLKSGMIKFPTDVLRFQTTDKAQGLKTTGEGYTITESQDILISDLEDPIFRPIKYTVDTKFTFSDLQAIQANPFGYIIFTENISGYLLNLKKKNNEDRAEITIIERVNNLS